MLLAAGKLASPLNLALGVGELVRHGISSKLANPRLGLAEMRRWAAEPRTDPLPDDDIEALAAREVE